MEHEVAADHREPVVGPVVADVLHAVGIGDHVLDHQVLVGADAESLLVGLDLLYSCRHQRVALGLAHRRPHAAVAVVHGGA